MKKLIIAIAFLPLSVFAQKKLITHKVAPKESIYSLARQYNVHPREIAEANKFDINTALQIGQEIKIPVSGAAPATSLPPAPAAVAKTSGDNPVYYTVGSKETLYGISKKYDVTVAEIKKWNNLTADGVNEGQRLIVGYNGDVPVAAAKTTATTTVSEPVKPEPVVSSGMDEIQKQKEALARQQRELEEKERKLKDLEEKQKEELAKAEQKRREAEEAKQRKEADKKTIEEIKQKKAETPAAAASTSNGKFAGGAFKSLYTGAEGKEQNGLAGVFKSTSGWEDGKYYCLHNQAPAGSIVKVTNPENGVSIYAKVLDVIPELKQNQNIVVRLSNSAAAELGKGETDFNCTVSF